jgi:predicted RNase H-like nuclease (RuvC/YqgF family)
MATTSTQPETNNNGRPLAEPVNYFEMDTKELTDSLEKRFNLSSSDQLNDKPRIVNGTPLKSALRNSNSKTKQRMDEKQLEGLSTEGHDEASVAYTRSLKSSETGVESRLS